MHLLMHMYMRSTDRPVTVAFVDHTAQLGGGEIALRNLMLQLDPSRVHCVALLFADGPLAKQLEPNFAVHIVPLAKEISETRKDTVGWKSLLRIRDAFSILRFIWELSRTIKRLNVQIVHTNSLKSHVLGGLAARLARRSVIWHLRDRIAPDYLPSTAVRCVRFLSRILPDVLIANSHATLATVRRQSESHGSSRSRVIHDGCEIPREATRPDSSEAVKIGLVGRISPWKGQHIFIRAIALLRDEFPSVRFQIIGAPLFSETEYEAKIKALCRELELHDAVEFTGFVADPACAISQLQILVHASTIGEPFGQVAIEGMAAGKPVIATQGGGIPEIVINDVTGLLVPMGDERALADAMATLLRDPAKARRMGERGRERVCQLFTLAHNARAVEGVYAQLTTAGFEQPGARQEPVLPSPQESK